MVMIYTVPVWEEYDDKKETGYVQFILKHNFLTEKTKNAQMYFFIFEMYSHIKDNLLFINTCSKMTNMFHITIY